MSDTQNFDKNSRIIRNLCQYFKLVGIAEVFLFVFILKVAGASLLVILVLGIAPGLITSLSAHSTFKKNKQRRGYLGAIWNMLKYNPIFLSMFMFILGDFSAFIALLMLLFGIASFVCSIILAVKISKHNRIIFKN